MAIIDDFDSIAKRMREIKASAPKDAREITELERWRDAALDTARAYVQRRRQDMVRGPFLRRRPEPTD
jgi:hypothetical protein